MSSSISFCEKNKDFWRAVLKTWLRELPLIIRGLMVCGLVQLVNDMLSWFRKRGITSPSEMNFLTCLELIKILDNLDYGNFRETECYKILSGARGLDEAYNLLLAVFLVQGEEIAKNPSNTYMKMIGEVLLAAEETLRKRGLTDDEIAELKQKATKCLELAVKARSEAAKEYAQRIRIKPIDWRKVLGI